MLKNIDLWIKNYLERLWALQRSGVKNYQRPLKVLFTICDHYEPFWNNVSSQEAYQRVKAWVDNYQQIASSHVDCLGNHPKHCFFYPEEEYKHELMEMIADICRNGFGEVEIHLHHDNDTAANLRKTLDEFKNRLHGDHGLLSTEKNSSDVRYGFIHGNWALDNSRPDGRWCGVNNEIDVLLETGCYADFTMPSAPDITQTRTVNSIYYAVDNPTKPKSHDTGVLARAGSGKTDGLLCVQGPLAFNFKSRKYGLLPRIENGCFAYDAPVTEQRVKLWMNQHIHVTNREDMIFIKLYTHGTQDNNLDYFFDNGGLNALYNSLEAYTEEVGAELYYVSARQMFNVVKSLESMNDIGIKERLNFMLTSLF